ncbi:MAG: hypothetical protein ACPGSD_11395 [Flavobacteriales bacterium]
MILFDYIYVSLRNFYIKYDSLPEPTIVVLLGVFVEIHAFILSRIFDFSFNKKEMIISAIILSSIFGGYYLFKNPIQIVKKIEKESKLYRKLISSYLLMNMIILYVLHLWLGNWVML